MIDLTEYGYLETAESPAPDGLLPARVTAVHREAFRTVCAYGEVFARLKAGVYYVGGSRELFPAVGDFVLLRHDSNGESLIVKTLPRRTCFSRKDPDPDMHEQVVAANFDYVFILSSLNHDFNLGRIQRYLAAAWQSGGIPVVVLTKADLCESPRGYLAEVQSFAPGVDVFAVSAQTGAGMEELSARLKPGETVVFLGSSGVGKSSLVNALAGGELMKVNAIREDDSKGRHTTTHRELFRLPSGALVIDTPGMRELGLWGADEGIREAFADVEELLTRCRFSNCAHNGEPGCAVQAAVADGSLPADRWKSYLALRRENAFNEQKAKQKERRALAGRRQAPPRQKRRGVDESD